MKNSEKKDKSNVKQRKPVDHTSPEWKGYGFDELTYMIEINKIKQLIITEQLEASFNAIKTETTSHSSGFMSRFNSIASFADYGIIGFKIFNRVRNIYRSLKK